MVSLGRWCLSSLLALLLVPGAALAQEQPPCGDLKSILDSGASASEAVRAAVASGFTLSEAAVYTLVCGGEEYRMAIATARVPMSGNMVQAQSVASALLRTAGQTGPVATAVDQALNQYIRAMPQPSINEDFYTPHGGGVSPAS